MIRSPNAGSATQIKCLNQHQVVRVIRFRGDGTGERVSWSCY